MSIRKIVSPDIQTAMRRVKAELGPDAVIVRSQTVPGGIEVTAQGAAPASGANGSFAGAGESPPTRLKLPGSNRTWAQVAEEMRLKDRMEDALGEALEQLDANDGASHDGQNEMERMRDELTSLRQLVEGFTGKKPPAAAKQSAKSRAKVTNLNAARDSVEALAASDKRIDYNVASKLEALGLSHELCGAISARVRDSGQAKAWPDAVSLLAKSIKLDATDPIERGGVIALIGATGVGKTTTAAKLAARLSHQFGPRRIAFVTTDFVRIGGSEQLRTFARALNCPLLCATQPEELEAVLDELSGKRLVIIDTAGMSHRDVRLKAHLEMLDSKVANIRSYLVLSASMQQAALAQTVQAFSQVPLAGTVVTKLDEAGTLGPIITTLLRYKLNLAYLTNGPRVPEDLHRASSKRLLNAAMSLADLSAEDREASMSDAGHSAQQGGAQ